MIDRLMYLLCVRSCMCVLGYSQHLRHSLKSFDILQNTQMGRLCDIRGRCYRVVYVLINVK